MLALVITMKVPDGRGANNTLYNQALYQGWKAHEFIVPLEHLL